LLRQHLALRGHRGTQRQKNALTQVFFAERFHEKLPPVKKSKAVIYVNFMKFTNLRGKNT
jgi:hypothetical protein